jgi:hypothetical protein
MIAGVIIKEIEYRAVDRGFGLQTSGVAKVFSCGEADEVGLDEGLMAHGEPQRLTERGRCSAGEASSDRPCRRIRAAKQSSALPPAHANHCCRNLTSGLEIVRPFCHWVYPHGDDQD